MFKISIQRFVDENVYIYLIFASNYNIIFKTRVDNSNVNIVHLSKKKIYFSYMLIRKIQNYSIQKKKKKKWIIIWIIIVEIIHTLLTF